MYPDDYFSTMKQIVDPTPHKPTMNLESIVQSCEYSHVDERCQRLDRIMNKFKYELDSLHRMLEENKENAEDS